MPDGDIKFLEGQFVALERHLEALVSNQVQICKNELREAIERDRRECREDLDKKMEATRLELERRADRAAKRSHVYSFLGGIVGGIVTSVASHFGFSKP